MSQEEIARSIATAAHEGQVDKAGRPYITHPARVAARMQTDEGKAVAWLHDTVEDTSVTLEDLREAGLSAEVVDAVDAMTHREGVSYFDYVQRASRNRLARAVKLSDLTDNTNLARLGEVRRRDLDRVHKYARSRSILMDALAQDIRANGGENGIEVPNLPLVRHVGTLTIQTERLTLRRLVPGDAENVWAIFGQDPRFGHYLLWPPSLDRESAESSVEKAIDSYGNPSTYVWAIERSADANDPNENIAGESTFIGITQAFDVNDVTRSCELGIVLGSAFWGHGYATETERAVIDVLFGGSWFNRVQATCHVNNDATRRLMSRLGMSYEGTLREAAVNVEGELGDLEVHSILWREWMSNETPSL